MSYTPDYFKALALNLRFRLSDEEALAIQAEFETLESQISLLENIDTEGVEPMVYPYEVATDFLREDSVSQVLEHDAALSNASKTHNGYVIVEKVLGV